MEELKERFAEWTSFVNTREAERVKLAHPSENDDLKAQIADKKAEALRVKAELQMLQAQLVIAQGGTPTYSRAAFDFEWGRKKTLLKAEVERLMAQQIEAGVSIPKLMKELQCKNPAWLYSVRENLHAYRGVFKEDMAQTDWNWSDVTSVHRYALGHEPEGSGWGFVLMHGAVDSEFEHEQCMFDFKTGAFIAGNRQLFDSVTTGVKHQRSQMLAQILEGTYLKKVRRDTNPYFTAE